MAELSTTKEFTEMLRAAYGKPDASEAKPIRYVIYARKSTDDNENQTRSLPDQVDECMQEAEKRGLSLGNPKVVREAESAKVSGKRPLFTAMLDDIRKGKYDAILAWHPDRLARNMKEAGEIIDLVDRGIIRNLHFVSFNFENTPSGLMHLGITFVLAKQYSDQLSTNVLRGISHSMADGEYINRPKHGYYKDDRQFLRPDGRNYDLLKQAFQMRIEGKTLKQAGRFLNTSHYERAFANGERKPFKWREQAVQKMMRDPIYTGVSVYGKAKINVYDLTEIYDFRPMISVQDFLKINRLKGGNKEFIKLVKSYYKGEDVKADFLRGRVLCSECGEAMSTGLTRKRSKKGVTSYFYYRCDTEGCPRHSKSTRAKVIVDYVNKYLADRPFSSRRAYDHYVAEMKRVEAERGKERVSLLRLLKGKETALTTKIANIKELIYTETDEQFRETYKGDLLKAERDHDGIEEEITKLKKVIADEKTAVVLMPEFLELMEKMRQIIASTTDMSELDFCVKKIFSNFSVSQKYVEKSTLSEPFAGLIDPENTIGDLTGNRTPV